MQSFKISPDTFRHRLRQGDYPEPIKVGGKRRFQIDQIKNVLKITAELTKKGILLLKIPILIAKYASHSFIHIIEFI